MVEREITLIVIGLLYVLHPIILGIMAKEINFKHPVILAICGYFVNGIFECIMFIIGMNFFNFNFEKATIIELAIWLGLFPLGLTTCLGKAITGEWRY